VSYEQDKALVNRVLSGDNEAFRVIYDSTRDKVRGRLCFMYQSSDVDDPMQDVYLTVFSKLAQFRGESSLSTWICRIAINLSLMSLRSKKNRVHTSFEEMTESQRLRFESHYLSHSGTEGSLELKQTLSVASRCLGRRQYQIFSLRVLHGFDTKETAEIMGISQGTVKAAVHRARVKVLLNL
jgi:RNA polymerase sigma-70 factor, ECF subfamily